MNNWRYPGLQLDEDLPLQEREWLLQRIAWAFLYSLLLAIILGALGSGPISQTVEKSLDGTITVEYERFMRLRSPETMRLTVVPSSGTVHLLLDSEYMRQIEIKKIVPEPDQIIFGMDSTLLEFSPDNVRALQIAIHFQPEKVGELKGWVALDARPRLALKHFVYP